MKRISREEAVEMALKVKEMPKLTEIAQLAGVSKQLLDYWVKCDIAKKETPGSEQPGAEESLPATCRDSGPKDTAGESGFATPTERGA